MTYCVTCTTVCVHELYYSVVSVHVQLYTNISTCHTHSHTPPIFTNIKENKYYCTIVILQGKTPYDLAVSSQHKTCIEIITVEVKKRAPKGVWDKVTRNIVRL